MPTGYVYIMTNKKYGTLYTGVTNNIARRSYEHKEGTHKGFTKQYRLKQLVYVEEHPTITGAIQREKNIKEWNRKWKIDLIESINPGWHGLGVEAGYVEG